MATADPTRAPSGGESVWSYSHLPRGVYDAETASALAKRMDEALEAHAPGFHDRVVERWVQLPSDMESDDPSLVHGAINSGTAQLHQQLVFRPLPGLGRAETPIDRLYLAGSSAHPGGGVHGAAGHIAAQAALYGQRSGGSGQAPRPREPQPAVGPPPPLPDLRSSRGQGVRWMWDSVKNDLRGSRGQGVRWMWDSVKNDLRCSRGQGMR